MWTARADPRSKRSTAAKREEHSSKREGEQQQQSRQRADKQADKQHTQTAAKKQTNRGKKADKQADNQHAQAAAKKANTQQNNKQTNSRKKQTTGMTCLFSRKAKRLDFRIKQDPVESCFFVDNVNANLPLLEALPVQGEMEIASNTWACHRTGPV